MTEQEDPRICSWCSQECDREACCCTDDCTVHGTNVGRALKYLKQAAEQYNDQMLAYAHFVLHDAVYGDGNVRGT